MSDKRTCIYESAQLEKFEMDILAGRLKPADLKVLIESDQLSDAQWKIVEELAPMLGGFANAAKGIARGIGSTMKGAVQQGKKAIQQGTQNIRQNYQQGQQNQQNINAQRSQAKAWQAIDQTIVNSKLLERMEKFRQMFPQDKFVNDATVYFNKVLVELEQYLAKQYPHMGLQQQQGFQHQSEIDAQKQQQAAGAQANMGGQRSDNREAQYANQPQPQAAPTQSKPRSRTPSQNQRELRRLRGESQQKTGKPIY